MSTNKNAGKTELQFNPRQCNSALTRLYRQPQQYNAWRTGVAGSPKLNLFCMDKTGLAKPRFGKTWFYRTVIRQNLDLRKPGRRTHGEPAVLVRPTHIYFAWAK
jgi:hypothetical protein